MDTADRPLAPDSFLLLTQTARQIAETRDVDEKRSMCSRYFQKLRNDDSLELAIYFFSDSKNNKRASVRDKTLTSSACDFLEIDYENVFKPCKSACGSTTETIEKLIENLPSIQHKRQISLLSLKEIHGILEKLKSASGRDEKEKTLKYSFSHLTGLEIKYLIRLLTYGSLRTGLDADILMSTIAEILGVDFEEFRYASTISGSIVEATLLARDNRMSDAAFKLFHPIDYMLASRIDDINNASFGGYLAEENLDGIRCQVHADGTEVKLFSRNLDDISQSYPEVIRFLESRSLPKVVFDGVLCAFENDRILSSQILIKQKSSTSSGTIIGNNHSVLFIAYDLMYCEREAVLNWPAFKRRTKLEEICRRHNIPFSNQYSIANRENIDSYLKRSLSRGNNGLILKERDSIYEYGNRGNSWLKVKGSGGTFNVALLYAHASDLKRDGTYSEFTLGIRVDNDKRYSEQFIPIGKLDSSQIDEASGKLNEHIHSLIIDRYGSTHALQPEIVVEVEFDEIRINRRTKANYVLHRPRYKALHWDLGPHDTATLTDVESLYREKTERRRESQGQDPSFIIS